MFEAFANRRVLLLQGPVGPFFKLVARNLRHVGAEVFKVNFNAADAWYFSGAEAIAFRDPPEEWSRFLSTLLQERKIDTIFMFGDSRPHHLAAAQIAKQANVDVFVFEEGYLRPSYVTFEKGGTNFRTQVPKDPGFFLENDVPPPPVARPVGNTFFHVAYYAIIYSLILTYFSSGFPHYRHHRDWRAFRQACVWWLGAGRKLYYQFKERGILKAVVQHPGGYFFVPLQVHDDYQIKNSRFDSVEDFTREVVASFARHAPKDAWLVLKHHPRDRGFCDHAQLVQALTREHGLAGRLWYVHDLHLPTLLRHARGTVALNSTVGLSSLYHGTPVKCLDDCVYAACVSAQNLEQFWIAPAPINKKIVARFIRWLKHNVLLNGSFYLTSFWQVGKGPPPMGRPRLDSTEVSDWQAETEAPRPG